MINFSEKIPGSQYFTWSEACYLPQWQTHHIPSDSEQAAIIEQAKRLDKVRILLGSPISVNCWIRPLVANTEDPKFQGKNYNALCGGATNSCHIYGQATDFFVKGMSVDSAMKIVVSHLPAVEMAAENNGSQNGRNWLHLQSRPLHGIPWRIFNP